MTETLDAVGAKIDALAKSTDSRFEQVDRRFEYGFAEVAKQLAEQRADTDFAHGRLGKAINARFDRLERKVDQFLAALPPARRTKGP